MVKHFGIKVYDRKYGLELSRDKYAILNTKSSFSRIMGCCDYSDTDKRIYTKEWCNSHLEDCLKNFDLNMKYFSLLDKSKFNNEIDSFLSKHECFKEVSDLEEYSCKSGYYLMVLDKYSQIYIGTTDNIRGRVMQHWSTTKSFDRLLFPIGEVDTSIMSIDSFRALDTTRIYAYITESTYSHEDDFINCFSSEFVCNRVSGGLLTAISELKSRKLK